MLYLWMKTLHIIFVTSWFAGLFYLPRLFVNLAQETDAAANARLLLMSHKLYRFMTILAVPAVLLGFYLWLGIGIGKGPNNGWLHAKIFAVLLLIGYHHGCGVLLKKFARGENKRSHVWYRWFNEIPVVFLTLIVILVVLKPF